MEKITIDGWRGLELYFDPKEVAKAEKPGEILECLHDSKGRMPYSPMRCWIFATTQEGKKTIEEMRRICESGGNTKKVRGGVRKDTVDKD